MYRQQSVELFCVSTHRQCQTPYQPTQALVDDHTSECCDTVLQTPSSDTPQFSSMYISHFTFVVAYHVTKVCHSFDLGQKICEGMTMEKVPWNVGWDGVVEGVD